jgi:hypothetical protein
MIPKPLFVKKKNTYITFSLGISCPKFWSSSVLFKKLPKLKQLPNGRKCAQSGHPGADRSYIFSAESDFPQNFPRNFLGKQFFETFPQKILTSPNIVENIVLFYHVLCSIHFPAYQFSVSHKIV